MVESDIRLTPSWLLERVADFADAPLLDVCTEPSNPAEADYFFTADDDGLSRSWHLPIMPVVAWCNPPYSRGQVERWATKAIEEARLGCEILLLTKDDCRTKWNALLRDNCDARCRISRGVGFLEPDGNGGFKQLVGPAWGSCLWYFGRRRRRFERIFGDIGEIIHGLGPAEVAP